MFVFSRSNRFKLPMCVTAIFLSLLFLGGCGGDDSSGPTPTPPSTSGLVTISGQVTDNSTPTTTVAGTDRQSPMKIKRMRSEAGILGIAVQIASDGWPLGTTSTDKGGYFAIEVPVPDSGRLVCTFSSEGRVTYQKALSVKSGESYSVQAVLPKVETSVVGDDGVVSSDSFRIENLPAGASLDLYTGDPTTEEGRDVFPGDYAAATSESDDISLVSMAFFEASLKDSSGEVEFSSADVFLQLPEKYQDGSLLNPMTGNRYTSGDLIEWWSYDEDKAIWIQEDADPSTPSVVDLAHILSGDTTKGQDPAKLYVKAKVTHFSWWNADYPQDFAYFCVRVVDGEGKPIENMSVYSTGVTYMNTSRPVRTDSDGWASGIIVKKSPTASSRERAQIYAQAGSVKFLYDVKDGAEGYVTSDDLFTPYDETQCSGYTPSIKLANTIIVSFEGVIKGTVKDEEGKTLSGMKVYSSIGGVVTTDSSGNYTLEAPLNAPVTVYMAGIEGKEVTVTSKDEPQIVDFTIPNQAPVITKLEKDPSGKVEAGGSVTFTTAAIDPEGGTVSYSWEATEGTLSATTGASTVWTTPSTSNGTAQVTMTASDEAGKTTRMTLPVSWGDLPTPGYLRVTFLDDSGKPLPGVWVVLHKDDGTVEDYMQTNAIGVASFGAIGRSSALITCAYKGEPKEEYGNKQREISLLTARVPVADIKVSPMDSDKPEGELLSTINIGVNNTVEVGSTVNFAPINAGLYGEVASVDANVYSSDVQTDGKVSILAIKSKYEDEGPTIEGWGHLYDQTLTSGDIVRINLDGVPVSVPWTSDSGLTSFYLTGERKGVDYDLGNFWNHMITAVAKGEADIKEAVSTSGNVQTVNFEVDNYSYVAASLAGTNIDPTYRIEARRLGSSRPSSFSVDLPDYLITGVSLDKGDRTTVTWRLEGTDDMDVTTVEVSGYFYDSTEALYVNIDWDNIMSPVKGDNSYVLPILPKEVADWFQDLWSPSANIIVSDFDNVSGYDSLMNLFLSGEDPMGSSLRMLEGDSSLEYDNPLM